MSNGHTSLEILDRALAGIQILEFTNGASCAYFVYGDFVQEQR